MNIFKLFRRLGKKTQVAIAVFAAAVTIGVPVVVKAGYGPNGPDRVIYDFTDKVQREGAFDAPRFNSYINTNVYGDERAFLDTKACVVNGPDCYKQGTAGGYQDKSTAEIGKEYIVRAYVHNDAHPSINGANNDGIGVAKDTTIRFEIPKGIGNGITMQARISASNSIPTMVYDTADLNNGNQAFSLQYVPGSAYISNAAHPDGKLLGDDIVGANGVKIGYDQMNGVFPGCFPFSAFVTIRVKIVPPSIDVQKTVSTLEAPTPADVHESVNVKRGDAVTWRIDYKNTGVETETNLTIRDTIPAGLTLVPGSIKWFDSKHPNGFTLKDTDLGSGGANVGSYIANGNGMIRFRTTVNKDFKDCEIVNVAYGRADQVPERSDGAKIVITDCQPPKPVASYECTLLALAQDKTDAHKVTTTITANHDDTTKVSAYVLDFGDGSAPLTTTTNPYTYTYKKEGNFTIVAKVNFTLANTTSKNNVGSNACIKSVSVTTTPPVTPAKLVDTGAGNTIALFAATSFIGAFLYRSRLLRNVR